MIKTHELPIQNLIEEPTAKCMADEAEILDLNTRAESLVEMVTYLKEYIDYLNGIVLDTKHLVDLHVLSKI